MAKIDPFLWFQKDCEAAVDFYVSTFEDAEILNTTRAREGVPGIAAGDVMTIEFSLFGQHFVALNGGPQEGFDFTSAISFVVNCETQEEVDHYWDTLSEGGRPDACGWLTDKFGLCWKIGPENIGEILKHAKEMAAMMKMINFDIGTLEAAAKEYSILLRTSSFNCAYVST